MGSTIHQTTLDKLVHRLQEVRVRSLHDIENTVKRTLWENSELIVNASALFKNLIRWFGLDPICEEVTVLELMSLLLESKYGQEVVKFFGKDRIIKELNKICYLIGSNEEHEELVRNLIKQVRRMKSEPMASSSSTDSTDVESVTNSMGSMHLGAVDISGASSEPGCARSRNIVGLYSSRWNDDSTFFTECWEIPEPSVLDILERVNKSLFDDKNEENFQRALDYVQSATKDYPAEFFLQPPYIGLTLLHLIETGRLGTRKGFTMLHHLVETVRKRMRQRMFSTTYISAEKTGSRAQVCIRLFFHEICKLGIEQLKQLSCDVDKPASNIILIVLNHILSGGKLEMCTFNQQRLSEDPFMELFHAMGYLVKHYRQEWESDSKKVFVRTCYRILLRIMLEPLDFWRKVHTAMLGQRVVKSVLDKITYNAKDYDTLNSTVHLMAMADSVSICECHLALMDYPLMLGHPEMYDDLLLFREDLAIALGTLKEKLFCAVRLLRDSTENANLSAQHLLMLGSDAICTLFIHKSIDMVRIILQAVGKCAGTVTEDGILWEVINSTTLRLLAQEDDEIRSEVYEICMNMMKEFIGHLDESAILTRRVLFSSTSPKLRAMGMPLSVPIVKEIVCFGCTSENAKIRRCAETMLLFLCNSKVYLHSKRADVEQILLAVAPLLQTVAVGREQTNLRKAVLGMFHPDFGLSIPSVFMGNLLFLYHEDSTVRQEALTRVLFVLTTMNKDGQFMPRIEHIGDTIPNGICLLSYPFDIGRQQTANVYDKCAVQPLLDTLERDVGDPALRRSALTQLNVMADDPELCEVIHAAGWGSIMKALENSLQADHSLDYPDSAIPAVGILTKLCFNNATFRRDIGKSMIAVPLIVRALLVHHHMPVFRVECCALLYLMLFAHQSVGQGSAVSLPAVCQLSSYRVPFVSSYHMHVSPSREFGPIEQLLNGGSTDGGHSSGHEGPSGSILHVRGPTDGEEESTLCDTFIGQMFREYASRCMRVIFADLWYDGFYNILRASHSKGTSRTSDEEQGPTLTYEGNGTALKFSPALRLRTSDIDWLKVVDYGSIFRKCARRLGSAKAHADVYSELATIEANLAFPLPSASFDEDAIIAMLKRYILTPPMTAADQELLCEVYNLFGIMLEQSMRKVHDWLLSVLKKESNIFVRLLSSKDCIESLYTKNVALLRLMIEGDNGDDGTNFFDVAGSAKRTRSGPVPSAWGARICTTALQQLDIMQDACDLPRTIALVELLETLSAPSSLVRVDIMEALPKLLRCILHVGSTTYTGSTIVRACMVSIAHLADGSPDEFCEFEWKPKYVKLISVQCGNSCTIIRSLAWNILTNLARTLNGAKRIVTTCAYLPGGIHACCVSTILDGREACLVREAAVGLLINLISHKVLPVDGVASQQPSGSGIVAVLMELFERQHFFRESLRAFEHYTDLEVVQDERVVFYVDLLKAYAVLFRCLIELDSIEFGTLFEKQGCVSAMLSCISVGHLRPTRSLCVLVTEICCLMVCLLSNDIRTSVCVAYHSNQGFFHNLIRFLDPDAYTSYTYAVMERTMVSVMHFMNVLVADKVKDRSVYLNIGHVDLKPVVAMLGHGIVHKSKAFKMMCYKFLALFISSYERNIDENNHKGSIMSLIDSLDINPDCEEDPSAAVAQDEISIDEDVENINPNRPKAAGAGGKRVQMAAVGASDGEGDRLSGAVLLIKALIHNFRMVNYNVSMEDGGLNDYTYNGALISAIQTVLHYSKLACREARKQKLLTMVLDMLRSIHETFISRQTSDKSSRRNKEMHQAVVYVLTDITGLLSAWFSVPGEATLLTEADISTLCRVYLLYWPWFIRIYDMQCEFLNALSYVTETNILVCKSLAATFPGFPDCIVKLLSVLANTETVKVRGPKINFISLKLALRVLINCCCCQEGRSMIKRLNVFEIISKLHPSVTKQNKSSLVMTHDWLEFWEVYTRYTDANEVQHLTVLGAIFRKSTYPTLRLLVLSIIRNLTFVPSNRAALLASSDYMFILHNALLHTSPSDEVLLAAVAVWKMVANHQKGKAAMKNSPIFRLIGDHVKRHSLTQEDERPGQDELWKTLMTVYRILQS